jgi:hypothetical protein
VAPAGRHASRRTSRVVHCYTTNSFAKKSGGDDTESLKYFNTLHASCSFYNIFFCFYYVFDVIRRLLRIVIRVLFNPNQ